MSTIRITVNGAEHTLARESTLAELLNALRPSSDERHTLIASAVNGRHVARQARASLVLNDQDVVTTFEPITGG